VVGGGVGADLVVVAMVVSRVVAKAAAAATTVAEERVVEATEAKTGEAVTEGVAMGRVEMTEATVAE